MKVLALFLIFVLASCSATRPELIKKTLFKAYNADRLVQREVLSNGLKVLTYPRPGCGYAKIQMWVGVGSNHEEEFTGSGLSHFLEHSLFDGSKPLMVEGQEIRKGYKNDEIRQIIRERGGYSNAWTSNENTTYVFDVLKEDVSQAIDLMEALVLRADLKEEILVGPQGEVRAVINELKRRREDPTNVHWHLFMKELWGDQSYGVRPIGYLQPISQVTAQDLLTYYQRHYVPNNMALVVVGDVDHAAVVEKAQQVFVGEDPQNPLYPRKNLGPVHHPQYEALSAPRELIFPTPKVAKARTFMGYRAVPLSHPQAAAGIVMDMLLSTPTGSGLFQRTIQDNPSFNCLSIGTHPSFLDTAGYFFTYFFSQSPDHIERIAKTVQDIVDRIASGELTEDQVYQSKKIILDNMLRDWESLDGVVKILGKGAVSQRGYKAHRKRYEAIQKVTKEEVISFARQWLKSSNRVLVSLVPQGQEKTNSQDSQAVALKAPKKINLANNVDLIIQKDQSIPFFSLSFCLRGGVLLENEKNNGVGALLASLLGKKTQKYSRLDLQDELDQRGVLYGVQSGNNSLLMTLRGPSEQLSWTWQLARQILYHSRFDQDEFFINEKNKLIASARQRRRSPAQEVNRVGLNQIFSGHPYSLSSQGEVTSLETLTPQDLQDHLKLLCSGYLAITLTGDFENESEVLAWGQKTFGQGDPHRPQDIGPGPNVDAKGDYQFVDVPFVTKQTYISWYFLGPPLKEDEAIRRVIQYVLSNNLYQKIRIEKGLAYSAGAYFTGGFGPSCIIFYADTDKFDQLDEIRKIYYEEILALNQTLLPEAEIQQVARALAFAEARSNETLSNRSEKLALNLIYGEGLGAAAKLQEELKNVKPQDIQDFCRRWLNPNRPLEVIVRNQDFSPPAPFVIK